jgi:hypothetical protein
MMELTAYASLAHGGKACGRERIVWLRFIPTNTRGLR